MQLDRSPRIQDGACIGALMLTVEVDTPCSLSVVIRGRKHPVHAPDEAVRTRLFLLDTPFKRIYMLMTWRSRLAFVSQNI